MKECYNPTDARIIQRLPRHSRVLRMNPRERKFQLWGWSLFILCALFFLFSAARNHDLPYFVGSMVFLIACVIFIVPLVRRSPD